MNILILRTPTAHHDEAESIVRDLHYAGLPSQSHALLLVQKAACEVEDRSANRTLHQAFAASSYSTRQSTRSGLDAVEECHPDPASERVRSALASHFPELFIESYVLAENTAWDSAYPLVSTSRETPGVSPTDTVMAIARTWGADLIVVGSNSRARSPQSFEALVHLCRKAPCSVRVVHPRYQHPLSHIQPQDWAWTSSYGANPVESAPPDPVLSVLLCVDGSEESVQMVEDFSTRSFARGTRVHLLSVVNAREWNIEGVHHMLDYYAGQLCPMPKRGQQKYPRIESQIRYADDRSSTGTAADQILRYAGQHEIDSIFIPAPSADDYGDGEDAKTMTAVTVARRAETTVEVVRSEKTKRKQE